MKDAASRAAACALFAAVALASCREGDRGAYATGDIAQGRAYAENVCARCHAIESGETQSPDIGAPSFQVIADTPGMTSIALNAWLHTPHPSMPNFIIDADSVTDLSAYVLSLSNDD